MFCYIRYNTMQTPPNSPPRTPEREMTHIPQDLANERREGLRRRRRRRRSEMNSARRRMRMRSPERVDTLRGLFIDLFGATQHDRNSDPKSVIDISNLF